MNKDPTKQSEAQLMYMKKLKKKENFIVLARIIILIAIILLWETAARLKWIDAFIFSSPSRVTMAFWEMLKNGSIFYHMGITLYETFLGFILGTGLGVLLAIILWWKDTIYQILEPYLVVLNSLPKTALAPILIVWFGNNMKSIIITSILISIVITTLNTLTGFHEVDDDKVKLIYSFGGNKLTVLKKVMLPANIPTLMNVLKVNIGLCLVGVIIGEFLVAGAGLGYLIVYGSQIFKLDWVMMSIIILSILAALLYKLILIIEKKITKHFM